MSDAEGEDSGRGPQQRCVHRPSQAAANKKQPPTGSSNIGAALLNVRKRKLRLIQSAVRRVNERQQQQLNVNDAASLELVSRIRQLALSTGGLLADDYRAQLWPVLAQVFTDLVSDEYRPPGMSNRQLLLDTVDGRSDVSAGSSSHCDSLFATPSGSALSLNTQDPSVDELRSHAEWRQVELDVTRTLARFPAHISDDRRHQLQQQLVPLVVRLLYDQPDYQYYQGFHDICLTFLLVLGAGKASCVSSQVASCGLFRHFLCEPLEQAAPRFIHLIYVILRQTDRELEQYLRRVELGHMFGLSWLLTWYAHSLDTYEHVVRLYDLFLASHHLMPVYFGASLVLYRASEIMDQCEPEMPAIHSLLSRMPKRHFPLEALIDDALDLFQQYPPKMLCGELSARYDREVGNEARQHQLAQRRRRVPVRPMLMVPMMAPSLRHNALNATVWALTATAAAAWYFYAHSDSVDSWTHIF